MTQDEIIEMARQTGVLAGYEGEPSLLIIFAKAMMDVEREACALKAEDFLTESELDWDGDFWNQAVERVAMAIRTRGQT